MAGYSYNERKKAVLLLLTRRGDWVTCAEVSEAFGISQSLAANLLRGYSGDGLTKRRRVAGPGPPVYAFQVGEKGRKKLAWLLGRDMAQAPLPIPEFQGEEVGRPPVLRPRVVKKTGVIRPRILERGS